MIVVEEIKTNKKGNYTSRQTSGPSLTITFIRSSRGSKVRLSEGVYGPHATKTFRGSAIKKCLKLAKFPVNEIDPEVIC